MSSEIRSFFRSVDRAWSGSVWLSARVKREGKYAVAAYVLPLPLIPATKTEACQALGSAIAERLQSVEQKPATQPPL
jgi:hypothetical protein